MNDILDGGESETQSAPSGSLAQGLDAIRAALKTLPASPGVYRMLDRKGDAVYVGKARNLKARVQHYTVLGNLSTRLRRMVAETRSLEVVVTHTEVEALLLENNLIKRLMPRYNVLLRDDKSFPFIHLTSGHAFPRLTKYRGARSEPGEYFGPFASAGAVARTLVALQRAFLLRSCSDSVFETRTRPCLLFQIKRCSAPCVGRIDAAAYGKLMDEARNFLRGRSSDVQKRLAERMQQFSDSLDFEAAAVLRDRIRALTHVQGRQDVTVAGLQDADVIAIHQAGGHTCVQVFFFRSGQNWGNRAYFPSHDKQLALPEVLASFLGQFYENKPPPKLILLSHEPTESALIAEALAVRAGHGVRLLVPRRGEKRAPVEHALVNAREALARRLAESSAQLKLLEEVAQLFNLDGPPQRIEVFDNSHIQGTHAVGAMIVAGPDGLIKNAYRKFSIRGTEGEEGAAPLAPGDDYGMMREVLTRRFGRAIKEDPARESGSWPDLVLIDGGQGQLATAQQVLADLGISDVPLVAIAKGPDRDAGRERFFLPGKPPMGLDPKSPVLYYLQRLRDEAHRFAIGTHRARRAKAIGASPLDEIAGIGARRKKALLHHFGSARGVARAGLADLEQVEGISKAVAKKIYEFFHEPSNQ
ncbi:MAG TPA: excinuclease ABC subunit UvrC [Stellaceae bacterium]|nr:excinuclease ABC subunit UvrC [Stellaceae bacterium]